MATVFRIVAAMRMVATPRGPAATIGVVAVAATLAIAGCTSKTKSDASPTRSPSASVTPAVGWTRADLRPVSQPAFVAGRFVLFTVAAGQLNLTGLDPRTGETVWTDAASSAENAPGVTPYVAISRNIVVYLHALGGSQSQLVGVNARTGEASWQGPIGDFTSFPAVCPGSANTVCLSGNISSDATPNPMLRFDAATGTRLPTLTMTSMTSNAREITLGLYDAGHRQPELLVAASGTNAGWTRDLASIFTLAGSSTDDGWMIDRVGRDGLFVGSVGTAPVSESPTTFVADLSRTMTAGFRLNDGSVSWRNNGSQYACGYLPCVGASEAAFGDPATLTAGPAVGVRLRMTGTISGSAADPTQPAPSANARVSIEGFSLDSGKTTWTFNAGRNPGLISQSLPPGQSAANTIVLPDSHGNPVTLNLADGSVQPAAAGLAVWCRAAVTYQQNVSYSGAGGQSTNQYVGQEALFPCDIHGHRLPSPATAPDFIGGIGATAAGVTAWSDTAAVRAAPAHS